MRTTLTLDDDVAMLLKKFSEETGLTFRDAVNQSIRRGLIPQALREAADPPTAIDGQAHDGSHAGTIAY